LDDLLARALFIHIATCPYILERGLGEAEKVCGIINSPRWCLVAKKHGRSRLILKSAWLRGAGLLTFLQSPCDRGTRCFRLANVVVCTPLWRGRHEGAGKRCPSKPVEQMVCTLSRTCAVTNAWVEHAFSHRLIFHIRSLGCLYGQRLTKPLRQSHFDMMVSLGDEPERFRFVAGIIENVPL